MVLVVDASIALAWAFPDEHAAAADAALDRLAAEDGQVPALWWFEVRNALIAGERRGRIEAAATTTYLRRLARLPIVVDQSPDEAAVLGMARQYRLTVYDAAYLELAARVGATLASTDRDLIAAAPLAGVGLLAAP